MNTSAWNPRAKFACGVLSGFAICAAPANATVWVPDAAHIEDIGLSETIVARCVLGWENNSTPSAPLIDQGRSKTTLTPLASGSIEEWSAMARDELAMMALELECHDGEFSADMGFDNPVLALGRATGGLETAESAMGINIMPTHTRMDATQSEELTHLRSTATQRGRTVLATLGFGR